DVGDSWKLLSATLNRVAPVQSISVYGWFGVSPASITFSVTAPALFSTQKFPPLTRPRSLDAPSARSSAAPRNRLSPPPNVNVARSPSPGAIRPPPLTDA